jgi:hypothetical protein
MAVSSSPCVPTPARRCARPGACCLRRRSEAARSRAARATPPATRWSLPSPSPHATGPAGVGSRSPAGPSERRRGEGEAGRLVVVPGEVVRPSPDPDLHAAPTRGLGNCDVASHEERMARRRVQHVDAMPNRICAVEAAMAASKEGPSQALCPSGAEVTWSKQDSRSKPASSAASHDASNSSKDPPH